MLKKKPIRILLIMVLALPVAIVSIKMKATDGDFVGLSAIAVGAIAWSAVSLHSANHYFHQTNSGNKRMTTRFRIKLSWLGRLSCHRALKLLCFTGTIVSVLLLVFEVIFGSPLSRILGTGWWLIMDLSEFVFVSILTDKNLIRNNVS